MPGFSSIYKLSTDEHEAMREYVDSALCKQWIQPSKSPVSATAFFVPKVNSGKGVCIDYRPLNEVTIKNCYPLPLFDNLIEQLTMAKIYTKLDLPNTYHLLRVHAGDEWKTAFHCHFGHFEYNVMPVGLTNAPATFQHLMNDIAPVHAESTPAPPQDVDDSDATLSDIELLPLSPCTQERMDALEAMGYNMSDKSESKIEDIIPYTLSTNDNEEGAEDHDQDGGETDVAAQFL